MIGNAADLVLEQLPHRLDHRHTAAQRRAQRPAPEHDVMAACAADQSGEGPHSLFFLPQDGLDQLYDHAAFFLRVPDAPKRVQKPVLGRDAGDVHADGVPVKSHEIIAFPLPQKPPQRTATGFLRPQGLNTLPKNSAFRLLQP